MLLFSCYEQRIFPKLQYCCKHQAISLQVGSQTCHHACLSSNKCIVWHITGWAAGGRRGQWKICIQGGYQSNTCKTWPSNQVRANLQPLLLSESFGSTMHARTYCICWSPVHALFCTDITASYMHDHAWTCMMHHTCASHDSTYTYHSMMQYAMSSLVNTAISPFQFQCSFGCHTHHVCVAGLHLCIQQQHNTCEMWSHIHMFLLTRRRAEGFNSKRVVMERRLALVRAGVGSTLKSLGGQLTPASRPEDPGCVYATLLQVTACLCYAGVPSLSLCDVDTAL
jgi:hypothetical protein